LFDHIGGLERTVAVATPRIDVGRARKQMGLQVDEVRAACPGAERNDGMLVMLLNFFGLREQPFGVAPDPSFLYLSATHREALASLVYGIESGRGFLALIAKPGMGKTTLLFHLLERFRASARTAFLFQTQCSSREFMQLLVGELGFETDGQDFVRMHDEFNRQLLKEAHAGKRFIVVIDEAQNLDDSVLETVRLLSDFETPRAKLLQIVLAGQPELGDKLASHGMAQLRQRVSIFAGLQTLSSEEIKNYVQHRLHVAGYAGQSLLTAEALAVMTDYTEGIPRNINNFCFNALSLACALRQKTVDATIAKEVIADLDLSRHLSQQPDRVRGRKLASPKPRRAPTNGEREVPPPAPAEKPANMTPAEAAAYMKQVIRSLRNSQT
jgi:general secretion pathway protein A